MTNSYAVIYVLKQKGYSSEEAKHILSKYMKLYLVNCKDCTAEEIADEMVNEENNFWTNVRLVGYALVIIGVSWILYGIIF